VASSRIHLCCGKAMTIKHYEPVCILALFIRHAKGQPHTIFSSVVYLASPYFSTLSHKRYDFRGKVIVHRIYVLICEINLIQKLWFINQHLAQHVSGTIMPIFRSARLYITAYGFQHLLRWKPYAVIYSLALLKMGIMVPETCWAKCWLISHNCCI